QRNTPWRQLMHHSDRGSQYCCKEYVDLLTDNKITISMTENGSPYENALAERVNGIIKAEFNLYCRMNGFEQMKEIINKTITAYN
ncbi:transposase family protein, partial [Chitinophaga ginsengisegetis]